MRLYLSLAAVALTVLPGSALARDPSFGPNDLETLSFIPKSDDHNRVEHGMRLDTDRTSTRAMAQDRTLKSIFPRLLERIFRSVAFDMASAFECRHRRSMEDYRRQLFAKLLGISPRSTRAGQRANASASMGSFAPTPFKTVLNLATGFPELARWRVAPRRLRQDVNARTERA